jgi:hypothetical protein
MPPYTQRRRPTLDASWEKTPPPPQRRHTVTTPVVNPIPKMKATSAKLAPTPRAKLVKKTAVDNFNDNRRDETQRLGQKRQMEHDEKMASINLKRRKYELRYHASGASGAETPPITTTTTNSSEDKQIQILRLQIQLAELTNQNQAFARQMAHSPQALSPAFCSGESSTPGSSSISGPNQGEYAISEDYLNTKEGGPSQMTGYIIPDLSGQGGSNLGSQWVETADQGLFST